MFNIIDLNLLFFIEYSLLITTGLIGLIAFPYDYFILMMNVILIFINLINFISIVLSSKIFRDIFYVLIDIDYYLYRYYLENIRTEKDVILHVDNDYDLENQLVQSGNYSELFIRNISITNENLLKLKLIQDMIGEEHIEEISTRIERKITKLILDKLSKSIYGISLVNMEDTCDLYTNVMINVINYLLVNTKYRLILDNLDNIDENRKIKVGILNDNKDYYEMFVLDSRLRKNVLNYYVDFNNFTMNKLLCNDNFNNIMHEIVNTKIIDGKMRKMIKIDYLDYKLNKINIDDLFD